MQFLIIFFFSGTAEWGMSLAVLSCRPSARQSLFQRRSRRGAGRIPPAPRGEGAGPGPAPALQTARFGAGTTPGRCPATLKHPKAAAESRPCPGGARGVPVPAGERREDPGVPRAGSPLSHYTRPTPQPAPSQKQDRHQPTFP